MNDYTSPELKADFIDKYFIRKSILDSLKQEIPNFSGELLDVGAGAQPYRELIMSLNSGIDHYCPLDLEASPNYPDCEYKWDGISMPFSDNRFECAIATEVLEHCPDPEQTLREIYRVLKVDGLLFFTVPFIWPLHDCPYDEYRYTPFSLERHLRAVGFKEIQLKPTGGWDASLAQVIGLWARRRPMTKRQRSIVSMCLLPIIKWLVKKDRPVKVFHNDFYMMPGISGVVRK